MKSLKSNIKIALFLVILIGVLFRFYNLNWGDGNFFHPDENNIARSVSQLEWPKLHPHFFAYGHFSIYAAYFLDQTLNFFKNQPPGTLIPFSQAISTLRFFSATEGIVIIFLTFLIGQGVFNPQYGLLAAALVAFTPGLIQAARFGTTESLLTLILLSVLYLSFKLIKKRLPQKIFLSLGIILGIGLSSKINTLVFLSFPLIALGLRSDFALKKLFHEKKFFGFYLLSFILAILISFLTSPYQFLDFKEFRRIVNYEINVAQGKAPVFYTRQFTNTQPILFQINQILPFSLNPFLEVTGLVGFFLIIGSLFGKGIKNEIDKKKTLLIWTFLVYFVPNSFTFAKWTRFITPILPFFALFSLEIFQLLEKLRLKIAQRLGMVILVSASFLFSLAFFSIYTRPDIRVTASEWMKKNLPPQTQIFSEAGNVVNLPLAGNFQVTNFDFYGLEEKPALFEKLPEELEKGQYLLIPSRRIFANHRSDFYHQTACYYRLLFSNQLGFEKIKEFSSYPSLKVGSWKVTFPDEFAEETWSVFDHPVIRLYQKKDFFSKEKYRQLFNQCLNSEND